MNITEIQQELYRMEGFLKEKKGFTRVHSLQVEVHQETLTFFAYVHDDFQDDVPATQRAHQGLISHLFAEISEVWSFLEQLPNRDRRELEVLLRQCAGIKGMEDKMESAAGRAFAAELQERAAGYRTMLEDLS